MIKIKKNVLMDLYFKGAYINEQETTKLTCEALKP